MKTWASLALTTLLLLAAYAFLYPRQSVATCNTAPYQVSASIFGTEDQAADGEAVWRLKARHELGPGDCEDFRERQWRGSAQYVVNTSVTTAGLGGFEKMTTLHFEFVESLGGSLDYTPLATDIPYMGSLLVCVPPETSQRDPVVSLLHEDELERCAVENSILGVFPAWHFSAKQNDWYFVWQDYRSAVDLSAASFEPEAWANTAKKSSALSQAVQDQMSNLRRWNSTQAFSAGVSVVDSNGPFTQGVDVASVADRSGFGTSFPFLINDKILEINGTPVFGERDLHQNLARHALSRRAGIEKEVVYNIKRGVRTQDVYSSYLFNSRPAGVTQSVDNLAVWYGAGDGVTFGQSPWAVCQGSNIMRFAGNVALGLGEVIIAVVQDKDINEDRYNQNKLDYIDARECKWQHEQARGYARQQRLESYNNSQLFALFTPSAVRLAGARLINGSGKVVKSGTLRSSLQAGQLEALETTLWVLGTADPAAKLNDTLDEAARFAVAGAGLSFTIESLSGRKERGKRK